MWTWPRSPAHVSRSAMCEALPTPPTSSTPSAKSCCCSCSSTLTGSSLFIACPHSMRSTPVPLRYVSASVSRHTKGAIPHSGRLHPWRTARYAPATHLDRLRGSCDGGGKRLHFHGVSEEVKGVITGGLLVVSDHRIDTGSKSFHGEGFDH